MGIADMRARNPHNSGPVEILGDYDVVICGGGLAGLTLARQLKLQLPNTSVVLIDRLKRPLPDAAFKVGESTVEIGAHYLARVLGLADYYERSHLVKLGLRFFFGDPAGPLQDRPEFGLSQFPTTNSYQIDRGVLENDLRRFDAEAGVVMLEGCQVQDIELSNNDGYHEVAYKRRADDSVGKVRARWVVDATGRRRFLQRKLNLTTKARKNHSAAWFRLTSRVDVSNLVQSDGETWQERVPGKNRLYSTNHLMGHGRWVWIIPLSSGNTSIGIVALEDIHPFSEFNTYEKALRWLRKHEPVFSSYIEGKESLDFRTMRKYSYSSRQLFSSQRWACVGEAGVFADPFYSPGVDLIGFANTCTAEMIKLDFEGKLTEEIVSQFDRFLLSLNDLLTLNIQAGYPIFGSAMAMTAKLIWDIGAGWAIVAPQMFNSIFLDIEQHNQVRQETSKFFFLSRRMQQLFVEWGSKSPGRLTYDFIDYLRIPFLREIRLRNLQSGKTTQELVADHKATMERFEELAQALFLVALEDVMPEYLHQIPSPTWVNAWGVSLKPERWQSDRLFQPKSEPRDLTDIYGQIRTLFRVE